MPMLDPAAIGVALAPGRPETDIATLATEITDPAALAETSVNKWWPASSIRRGRRARSIFEGVVPGRGAALRAYRALRLSPHRARPLVSLRARPRTARALEQLRALEAACASQSA